ncbi:MAG: hypothetical protein IJ971_00925 [Bacteroidales bacterium]|nr:hypothetical protein [Bacteroidales bacterium]
MNTKKIEAVHRLVNHLMTKLNMNESIEDIVRSYKEINDSVNHMSVGAFFEWMLFEDSDANSHDHASLPEKARMVYYPWKDVLASMCVNPDKVYITKEICPDCGRKLFRLHFSSPHWTWKHLCGRAGTMTICVSCPKQVDFSLEIMN